MPRISDETLEKIILNLPILVGQIERIARLVAVLIAANKPEAISADDIALLDAETEKIRERTDAIMAEIATAENGEDDE